MKKDKYPIRKSNPYENPFEDIFDDFFNRRPFRNSFSLFDDFEDQFHRMNHHMNTLFNRYQRGELPSPEEGGPYVYGYSFRVGPDGKPHFQEFGNIPSLQQPHKQDLIKSREPLVDIQECDKTLTIDVELPGVDKKEIDLQATTDTITIKVDNPERNYFKTIQLPTEINPDTADVCFNKGILSLTLEKYQPQQKGKKLNVK